jgi:hypothetical protein
MLTFGILEEPYGSPKEQDILISPTGSSRGETKSNSHKTNINATQNTKPVTDNGIANSTTLSKTKPTLLNLPQELQSIIWAYLIPGPKEDIQGSTTKDFMPPLEAIHTCQKLREEILKMYYGGARSFVYIIHDWDFALPLRFDPYLAKYGSKGDRITKFRPSFIDKSSAMISTRKSNLLHMFEARWNHVEGIPSWNVENPYESGTFSWRLFEVRRLCNVVMDQKIPWEQAKPVVDAAISAAAICGE